MRIRLTGTRAETTAASRTLDVVLRCLAGPTRYRVREISDFHPDRGRGDRGRVYLDVDVELPAIPEAGEPR